MTDRIKVFLSYSHKDKVHCEEFLDQLGELRHGGSVDAWWDRAIPAGADWEKEIERELKEADIILLLISPGFIGSKFCFSREMNIAIDRHEAREAIAIPIAIRQCHWGKARFAKLQALPEDRKPITAFAEGYPRDSEYAKIVGAISKRVDEIVNAKREKCKAINASIAQPVEPPPPPPQPSPADAGEGVRPMLRSLSRAAGEGRGGGGAGTVPASPQGDGAERPSWADAAGRDQYGTWASFTVDDITGGKPVSQRMRWIPPGRFLMGSPEDEPGRYDDEGPRHPVTISRGFWLMDTACPQALWQAVTGGNPSMFKDRADLPVESVSRNDVQKFLVRLNQQRDGLNLTLPTEAEWEYACRAGTDTPFNFDAAITPELVNYNAKTPYAGGKAGVRRQKTVPVASLPPNRWGLYEMHGNVWEWCRDGQRSYQEKEETDPTGPLEAGAVRALRGGSWFNDARHARAAYRLGRRPDHRNDDFGFRCSRVQS